MSILDSIAKGLNINPAEAYVAGRHAQQRYRAGEVFNTLRQQQVSQNALQMSQARAAQEQLAQLGPVLAAKVPEVMGDDPRAEAVQQGFLSGNPDLFAGAWGVLMQAQQASPLGRPQRVSIGGRDVLAQFDPTTRQFVPVEGATPPSRAPVAEVKVSTEGQTMTPAQLEVEKVLSKELAADREAIGKADTTLQRVAEFQALQDQFQTGSFGDLRLSIGKALTDVGVDPARLGITDNLAAGEALKSIGMGFVMDFVSQTKGAVSNKEMALFERASAGIGNTPQGNSIILAGLAAAARRKQLLVEEKFRWIESGESLAAWPARERQIRDAIPLFSDEQLAAINGAQ